MFDFLLRKVKEQFKDIFHPKNNWNPESWFQMPDFELDKEVMLVVLYDKNPDWEHLIDDIELVSNYGGNYGILLIMKHGAPCSLTITKEEYDKHDIRKVREEKLGEILR